MPPLAQTHQLRSTTNSEKLSALSYRLRVIDGRCSPVLQPLSGPRRRQPRLQKGDNVFSHTLCTSSCLAYPFYSHEPASAPGCPQGAVSRPMGQRRTLDPATPLMSEVPMAHSVVRSIPHGAPVERKRLEGAAYG